VDLRTGLDDLENRKFLTLPGLELRPLDRPARTLSRLLSYHIIEHSYQIITAIRAEFFVIIFVHPRSNQITRNRK
jgi:hypothetical protein